MYAISGMNFKYAICWYECHMLAGMNFEYSLIPGMFRSFHEHVLPFSFLMPSMVYKMSGQIWILIISTALDNFTSLVSPVLGMVVASVCIFFHTLCLTMCLDFLCHFYTVSCCTENEARRCGMVCPCTTYCSTVSTHYIVHCILQGILQGFRPRSWLAAVKGLSNVEYM